MAVPSIQPTASSSCPVSASIGACRDRKELAGGGQREPQQGTHGEDDTTTQPSQILFQPRTQDKEVGAKTSRSHTDNPQFVYHDVRDLKGKP